MATAHARDAARTVAAAYQALARTHWCMAAMVLDVMTGGMRIVRTGAARIEMDLRLGGAHGAENECEADE